jgi:hypothetical protein
MGQATVSLPPAVPPVPSDIVPDIRNTVIRFARAINAGLRGQISAAINVTLVANDTTSVFNDTRLGPYSAVRLMPLNDHARCILPTVWVAPTKGSCTLHHGLTPNADCQFTVLIIGS